MPGLHREEVLGPALHQYAFGPKCKKSHRFFAASLIADSILDRIDEKLVIAAAERTIKEQQTLFLLVGFLLFAARSNIPVVFDAKN